MSLSASHSEALCPPSVVFPDDDALATAEEDNKNGSAPFNQATVRTTCSRASRQYVARGQTTAGGARTGCCSLTHARPREAAVVQQSHPQGNPQSPFLTHSAVREEVDTRATNRWISDTSSPSRQPACPSDSPAPVGQKRTGTQGTRLDLVMDNNGITSLRKPHSRARYTHPRAPTKHISVQCRRTQVTKKHARERGVPWVLSKAFQFLCEQHECRLFPA